MCGTPFHAPFRKVSFSPSGRVPDPNASLLWVHWGRAFCLGGRAQSTENMGEQGGPTQVWFCENGRCIMGSDGDVAETRQVMKIHQKLLGERLT